ncbi:MAG: hypothetical protein ACI9HK_003785, partial [Pirellulaceae bacterium]
MVCFVSERLSALLSWLPSAFGLVDLIAEKPK